MRDARWRRMLRSGREEQAMHDWMSGWEWMWMSFMMVFWIVALGAIVYAAVKLANRPPTDPKRHL
jgi:hypothetical protein